MDRSFASYKVEERSYVSYIKREIHNQIRRCRFSQIQAGKIDIIVSEIASNIVKHAGSGELLFRVDQFEACSTFEIISIDNGPGIADTARMIRDGVSTTHTLGHGLGSINRLSDLAQLYSMPGWGTILYAMVTTDNEKKTSPAKKGRLEIRGLCVNKPSETVCGDGYRIKYTNSEVVIFLGDGLGHGRFAKDAMDRAGDFLLECKDNEPVDIIRNMHLSIRRTRGLVGTIATYSLTSNQWTICGVGNIFTRVYSGIEFKNVMPYNGTIGLNLPATMNSSILDCENNQHLIMCTDGIQSRWDLNKYPAILKYDGMILAAAIYKDFSRRNDDASVLIAKAV